MCLTEPIGAKRRRNLGEAAIYSLFSHGACALQFKRTGKLSIRRAALVLLLM